MADETTAPTPSETPAPAPETPPTNEMQPDAAPVEAGDDLGADEVQARTDADEEQGAHGRLVDPTPNEHYSLQGVTQGKPTPETHPEAAAEARKATGLR